VVRPSSEELLNLDAIEKCETCLEWRHPNTIVDMLHYVKGKRLTNPIRVCISCLEDAYIKSEAEGWDKKPKVVKRG